MWLSKNHQRYHLFIVYSGWLTGRAAIACELLADSEIMEDIQKHIFDEILHKRYVAKYVELTFSLLQ